MGVTPCTLEGPKGSLFAIHVTPETTAANRGEAVLYLPSFAEEMNRSRRMAALSARELAARGIATLILDPFGTGDSAGNFEDASWQTWCGDTESACVWLTDRGYERISLLGLRLGACLALQAAAAPNVKAKISKAILWQPVLKGSTFLSQFLRIRVAAGLGNADTVDKETVKDLRAQLNEGHALEVAGYRLTSELAAAVDCLDFAELALAAGLPLTWCELGAGPEPSPASQNVIERLRAGGIEVDCRVVPGEPYWSIEETTLAPALWQETVAVLAGAG